MKKTRQEMRVAMRACLSVAALGATLVACDGGSGNAVRGPNPDEIPQSVEITGGKLVSGFVLSSLRADGVVDDFRLTVSPITVHQYQQCVAVGGCKVPPKADDIPYAGTCTRNFAVSKRADSPMTAVWGRTADSAETELPLTCMTPQQAVDYCQWQGGRLPTLNEWLLATRGPEVAEYPWGAAPSDCSRHPGGASDPAPRDARCGKKTSDFQVAKHAPGASAAGVQDVLLTGGELLATAPDSLAAPCTVNKVCYVTGHGGGSLSNIGPTVADDSVPAVSAGFRCAFRSQK